MSKEIDDIKSLNKSELKELFENLSKDLSKCAIQKTNKHQTKKGYDTTGYGYQYCVDRLNELLLEKWGFDWEILEKKEGAYKSGTPYVEICVKMSIWIIDKENKRSCAGGHISSSFSDALKGAITNAFKKTVAFWGVGSIVYRGELDDDNEPYPDADENKNMQINKNKEIYSEIIKCLTSTHKNKKLFTSEEIKKYQDNAILIKDNLKKLEEFYKTLKDIAFGRMHELEISLNSGYFPEGGPLLWGGNKCLKIN